MGPERERPYELSSPAWHHLSDSHVTRELTARKGDEMRHNNYGTSSSINENQWKNALSSLYIYIYFFLISY